MVELGVEVIVVSCNIDKVEGVSLLISFKFCNVLDEVGLKDLF